MHHHLQLVDGVRAGVDGMKKHLEHGKKATEPPHTDSLSLRTQAREKRGLLELRRQTQAPARRTRRRRQKLRWDCETLREKKRRQTSLKERGSWHMEKGRKQHIREERTCKGKTMVPRAEHGDKKKRNLQKASGSRRNADNTKWRTGSHCSAIRRVTAPRSRMTNATLKAVWSDITVNTGRVGALFAVSLKTASLLRIICRGWAEHMAGGAVRVTRQDDDIIWSVIQKREWVSKCGLAGALGAAFGVAERTAPGLGLKLRLGMAGEGECTYAAQWAGVLFSEWCEQQVFPLIHMALA
jgi:hypothetical protein